MTETAIPETRTERLLQRLHDALLDVRSQVRALDDEVEDVLRHVRAGLAVEEARRLGRPPRLRRERPAGPGLVVAARRVLLGLSQRDLAHLTDYSRSLVAAVEHGQRTNPTTLNRIERVLEGLERGRAEWLAREGGAPCA